MSVGNATQAIDFDRKDLTLVLGENLDLGGDGSRNGTGKTTIINALSYSLYGQALSNIRKDNLVNKTNAKNMLVSLDFSVSGQEYRIERGRKPNILKFYVNNHEQEAPDDSQGDSRETQDAIEATLGMSHDMFKHILALNTYTEPFLSLKAQDQRTIIEQLLGITLLSERAERVKELNKITKDAITQEEFRIRAVIEANKRIEEQIESLRKRQKLWTATRDTDVVRLQQAVTDLEHIEIDSEIQAHRDLEAYNLKQKSIADITKSLQVTAAAINKQAKLIDRLQKDIEALDKHTCYACGHELHDDKQDEIRREKQTALEEVLTSEVVDGVIRDDLEKTLAALGPLGKAPNVFYDTLELALNHRNSVDALRKDLDRRSTDIDPYGDQIVEMQGHALQSVTYDTVNELTRLQEHQEFLLKLLTSKDSFIRKKIIEQNLSYLNARLTHYLERIGLPHTVVFQNDLTVQIEELGRELDFHNLSRGEMTRLVLSLSLSFRDVFESLYQPINVLFVDELLDNGLDSQGTEGALAILKRMSRERQKSIWLVSHKDDLVNRVDNTLKVIKEGGYTHYDIDYQTN